MSKVSKVSKVSKYTRVFDYASPYTSTAYEMDATGAGWDRLAAIAGEYERGEITWKQATAWCDDTERELLELAAARDV